MTREATTLLLEMVDDGLLDKDAVITACLKYMSEDDVKDMCLSNEFISHEELDAADEDEEED